jgi:hypothetical protein
MKENEKRSACVSLRAQLSDEPPALRRRSANRTRGAPA